MSSRNRASKRPWLSSMLAVLLMSGLPSLAIASEGSSAPKKPSAARETPSKTPKKKATKKKKASDKAAAPEPKKVAKRMPSKRRPTKKAEEKPCVTPAVTIDRGGLEAESLSLVSCKGEPLEAAETRLSLLARPWGVERPEALAAKGSDGAAEADMLAPNVRRIDSGLVTRLFLIAHHFSGKTVSIVSGYRPKSRGSLHQRARALDVRVAEVDNEALVAFCKTLPDTGCGYYPNSSFVHVDVRTKGTGAVSWIDASGPGEAPRYVTQWPPPPDAAPAEADAPVDEEADALDPPETKPKAAAASAPSVEAPPSAEAPKAELPSLPAADPS